eukprot:5958582-Amphidinium_carterae.1
MSVMHIDGVVVGSNIFLAWVLMASLDRLSEQGLRSFEENLSHLMPLSVQTAGRKTSGSVKLSMLLV